VAKCFLGNLDFRTDEQYIRRKFSKYGPITDVFLPKDFYSGKPRGFGFVTFENPKDAEYCVDDMDGRDFDGRRVTVNLAKPREDRPRGGGGGKRRGRSRSRSRSRGRGGYGGGGGGGYSKNEECRDFSRGDCSRGDSCRYSHSNGGGGDRRGYSRD